MYLPTFEHITFTYEHLNASLDNMLLIQDFRIKNPAGKNLARFLKELALHNEESNADRTYLVKDKITKDIVGFFSFRNGLFGLKASNGKVFNIPSIELSNFAVNDAYRDKHPNVKNIGENIFNTFIVPLAKYIQTLTGAQALCIYALPEERLINHYGSFGFVRLAKEDEQFVYDHIKPAYDEDCIFMYQIL